MFYLLDGYNLLHAMGVLNGRVGPSGLERARLNLLGILVGALADEARNVTVIFDARDPPRGLPAASDYHGVHVVFAVEYEQADDLIEQLIRQASAPKNLTVVSDDHRIQQAGRRRQCVVLGCQAFLESLAKKRRERSAVPADPVAKPPSPSEAETLHWLEQFRDLADDPYLKELFDPYEFLKDEDKIV
jgi:predicted RNA-binding protein with PIN domain